MDDPDNGDVVTVGQIQDQEIKDPSPSQVSTRDFFSEGAHSGAFGQILK
jgi:hypothetical protein